MQNFTLHTGDSLEILRGMPDNSVDSVVTDPPYGLGEQPDAVSMLRDWMTTGHHEVKGRGFMGKKWDAFVPQPVLWAEVYRVLKPGGHVLAFAGTRTQDLMCLGLRLAGFEIRDLVAWVYGSGFPKSLDVSKAIDKAAGVEREVVGKGRGRGCVSKIQGGASVGGQSGGFNFRPGEIDITAPATPEATQWQGWGTALKPALEPITLARKPLDGTVAANVLAWGTGALNIDRCRVGAETAGWKGDGGGLSGWRDVNGMKEGDARPVSGRWPANLIHDGSEEVVGLFPQTGAGHRPKAKTTGFGEFGGGSSEYHGPGPKTDKGSAARFFYCAKAQKKDRNEGITAPPASTGAKGNGLARVCEKCGIPQLQADKCETPEDCPKTWVNPERANHHPTVKPTDLMAYLCRLITPPGGLILDPFMGSGSTGKAAIREGFRFVGIDLSDEYVSIARARIEHEGAKQRQGVLPFAAE